MNNQVVAANEAARSVFRNAVAVMLSTFSSLPALNPYHPNQSRPRPSAMKGMLCGEAPNLRLPTYNNDATAAQAAHADPPLPPGTSRTPPGRRRPLPHIMRTNG